LRIPPQRAGSIADAIAFLDVGDRGAAAELKTAVMRWPGRCCVIPSKSLANPPAAWAVRKVEGRAGRGRSSTEAGPRARCAISWLNFRSACRCVFRWLTASATSRRTAIAASGHGSHQCIQISTINWTAPPTQPIVASAIAKWSRILSSPSFPFGIWPRCPSRPVGSHQARSMPALALPIAMQAQEQRPCAIFGRCTTGISKCVLPTPGGRQADWSGRDTACELRA